VKTRVKSQVVDKVAELEFEQFRHPEDAKRLLEIRDLAIRQLADDADTIAGNRRDRVGRANQGWVLTRDTERPDAERDQYEMWPGRTEDDDAITLALEPFLAKLKPEEHVLVELYFYARETHQEIADRLGTSRANITQRLGRIYEKLRELISEEFVKEEEPT
jgi:RNA polymerase sigma factor (sigma-70 family)